MGKRLAQLEEDQDAGKPGALQKLKAFRVERILFVDSIIQVGFHSADVCFCWSNPSNRVAPNLRDGRARKHRPRQAMLTKESPRDAKREYS
jgi:hypothetical protein